MRSPAHVWPNPHQLRLKSTHEACSLAAQTSACTNTAGKHKVVLPGAIQREKLRHDYVDFVGRRKRLGT